MPKLPRCVKAKYRLALSGGCKLHFARDPQFLALYYQIKPDFGQFCAKLAMLGRLVMKLAAPYAASAYVPACFAVGNTPGIGIKAASLFVQITHLSIACECEQSTTCTQCYPPVDEQQLARLEHSLCRMCFLGQAL